jgi:hypothetical protein
LTQRFASVAARHAWLGDPPVPNKHVRPGQRAEFGQSSTSTDINRTTHWLRSPVAAILLIAFRGQRLEECIDETVLLFHRGAAQLDAVLPDRHAHGPGRQPGCRPGAGQDRDGRAVPLSLGWRPIRANGIPRGVSLSRPVDGPTFTLRTAALTTPPPSASHVGHRGGHTTPRASRDREPARDLPGG